ncbi:MAG: hypothetical protein WDW36_007788 [Sanguina aurantia]
MLARGAALHDLAPGARLVELPSKCQLTYSDEDDPRLLSIVSQVPPELWSAKLALKVLTQRAMGKHSAFTAYISHLPPSFPGIPLFFNREAVEAIDYPPVGGQVAKRGKWLSHFSSKVLAPLRGTIEDPYDGVVIDMNALGWALSVVTSRAFRTRGAKYPASLLPLIDMANHSFQPNCKVTPVVDGGIAMVTQHKVSAGEPLTLNYGTLSNDLLFLDYGFVVPDNLHDRVDVQFQVSLLQAGVVAADLRDAAGQPITISPALWQLDLLERLNLIPPSPSNPATPTTSSPPAASPASLVTFGGPLLVDPRLLAAARLLLAKNAAELRECGMQQLTCWGTPISAQNEALTLRVLSACGSLLLGYFANSAAADRVLLQEDPVPGGAGVVGLSGVRRAPLAADVQTSVRFRLEKKKVLLSTVQKLAAKMGGVGSAGVAVGGKAVGSSASSTPSKSKGFGKK